MITYVAVSTSSLPPQQLSVGSGIFSMVRNVSGALGISVMISITLGYINSHSVGSLDHKLIASQAMKYAFLAGGVITLLFSPSLIS